MIYQVIFFTWDFFKTSTTLSFYWNYAIENAIYTKEGSQISNSKSNLKSDGSFMSYLSI